MVRVIWTPPALRDMGRLYRFLEPKNPDAARRAVRAIRQGVLALARHPEVGRPVDEMPPEFREFIPFGQSGYVGPYRYDGKAVVVLAVRHGRGEPLGTRANVLAACGRSGPLKQRMFSDSEPFVWCVWQGVTSFLVDPAEPVD